jgi:hypothetical protein
MISTALATWIVRLALLYILVGVVFAVPFVVRKVGTLDPVAKHGTWGFRSLILPGAVALWPLLLLRLVRGEKPRERNAHRDAAE